MYMMFTLHVELNGGSHDASPLSPGAASIGSDQQGKFWSIVLMCEMLLGWAWSGICFRLQSYLLYLILS